MKTNTFLKIICGTTLLVATGCQAHIFSPPANLAPMESVAVAQQGEIRIGGFVSVQTLGFGPDAVLGSLKARHGIGNDFEIGLDANLAGINSDKMSNKDDFNNKVFTSRVGGKWSPMGNYFALTAGVGGGTHTGGQFFAPDLGVVFAYENEYLIPFANISGYLSQPINAKSVDFSYDEQPIGEAVETPRTTYGASWSLGLKIPLANTAGVPLAPYVGITGISMWDKDNDSRIQGFIGGLDVTF